MKWLIAGLGGIGQRHVRNLRALAGGDIELIAFRVRGEGAVLTDKLGVETDSGLEAKYGVRAFSTLDAALAEKPDAALVCNPTSLHLTVAQEAAEAGCHLMVEKPLSDSVVGVRRLIDTVKSKNRTALVAYQWRFHPLLRRVRQWLDEGLVGAVASAQAHVGEYLPGWHGYEDYRRMYASRRDQGGGVVLTQIHEMDYLYWLFGRPSRVFALGGRKGELDIDVEDTASILLDFGGVGVQLHQDYLQRPPKRGLQIVGAKGKIVADLLAPRLRLYVDGELVEDETFVGFERNQMFMDEMRHFLACVAGRERPIVTLEDGLVSLEMALAARRSLETGKVVRL